MNSEFNNTLFQIEGICDWNLYIHKTVYPPKEDTYLLAKAILKLNKYDVHTIDKLIEQFVVDFNFNMQTMNEVRESLEEE